MRNLRRYLKKLEKSTGTESVSAKIKREGEEVMACAAVAAPLPV